MVNSRFKPKKACVKLGGHKFKGFADDAPTSDRVYNLRTSILAQFVRFAIVRGEFSRSVASRQRRVDQVWADLAVEAPEIKHHGRFA